MTPAWDGTPSKWEVAQDAHAEARVARAERIAQWRARHPEATCPDAAAYALAEMEQTWGRRKEI